MSAPILKNPKVQEEIKRIKDENSSKTKLLMKSIDQLKLDLEKEKYQNQDNVRAKIIERMKKDIADNETVIEMMREIISDDDLINKEIVKVLSKGPLRARVLSREELRMEIKKLTNEINVLKRGGVKKISKNQSNKSTEQNKDKVLEDSFANLTLEKYKEMKDELEVLRADLEARNKQIEEMTVDIKGRDMNLRMLMEKVDNMGEDKKAFERVKEKLKEFRRQGLFRNIELNEEEEDEDDTINSLNKLNKLLEQTKSLIDQKEKSQQSYKDMLEATKMDRVKEVDDLVDEYNMKDEEFQDINDKYTALKRECK